ncbi:STAS domain-containing protein [Streptomyces sp. NPDC001135]
MSDIHKEDRPGRLSIQHAVVDGVLIVTVHGEIDHDVKDVLSQALLSDDGATPPRIVADLSEVTFMDSSGINVFVTAHRRASGAQGWLRIAGAQDSVVRLLHLVGVDEIIPCHPTLQQALSNCPLYAPAGAPFARPPFFGFVHPSDLQRSIP